ncbi:MAG: 30S ribosomal protein S20 [Mycoplasmoidaceae bacterium]
MANIKSNEKNYKRDAKRKTQRHSQKSNMKTQIKKTVKTKDQVDLNQSYKKIDSSVSKGLISKNKGDRMKSRLANSISK